MKTAIALSLLLPVAAFAQAKPPVKKAPPLPPPTATAPAKPALEPVVVRTDSRPQESIFVAPKVGLFVPTTRMSSAPFVGAEVGFLTPLLDRHLAAVVEVTYARPRAAGVIADPRLVSGAGGEYTEGTAEVSVALSAVYRFAEAAGLTPYLGAGPGLYFNRTTVDAFGSRQTESQARIGLQLLGGAELKLGPGSLFGEVQYRFTRIPFTITGNVNPDGFVLPALGYRLAL